MKSKVQKIIILIAMIIFFTALTISPNELNASEDFNKINISDTNTVIFGIRFEPSNIDPHVTWDPNDYHSIDQVVEGLFGYNLSHPQMLLIPKLAEDFGVWTENNYTVNIKQGVTFHDGTPLDANAVKWNFDRLAYFMENYLAQARELYEYYDVSDGLLKPIINRTEVVDTHTIKFILNKVVGHFETLLSFYGSYILSPSSTSATAPIDTETGDLVGTGPFMYDNYIPNVEVNFHRNENYWAGLANITHLKFSIFNDTTTLNNALLSGDVDLIVDILPSMLDTFIADPNVILESTPGMTINYLGMNNYWINTTYRKAISYAIDYDYILNELLEGQGLRLRSPLPENMLYANSSYNVATYDVAKARETMQSMGYGVGWDTTPGGIDESYWTSATFATFNYTYNIGNKFREDLYTLLYNNLEAIGIEVIDAGMTWGDFFYRLFNIAEGHRNMLQMFWLSWIPDFNDPYAIINYIFNSRPDTYNFVNFNDSTVQTWIEDAEFTNDPILRSTLYNNIQQKLVEESYPCAFGYINLEYVAYRSNISGFQLNPMGKVSFYEVIGRESEIPPPPPPPDEFISIDGSSSGIGAHNWTWAASQDWCSGSGTLNDPYIIENLYIDGGGLLDYCIEIRNSNVHFILRNCTLFNASVGIELNNVSNGILEDGVYSDNYESGVVLSGCIQITISNNVLTKNGNSGIYVFDGGQNSITNNLIYGESNVGIYIYSSNFTTIVDNIINNCTMAGIYVYSDFNTIFNNVMSRCGLLIYPENIDTTNIDNSNSVDGKPIYVYKNQAGLGFDDFSNAGQIILSNCYDSTIQDNLFENVPIGVLFHKCLNITIVNNDFINTTAGIYLWESNFVEISGNNITNSLQMGIVLDKSNNTSIINNEIASSPYGIHFLSSSQNRVIQNLIQNNGYSGILIDYQSENNLIFDNYFIENNIHAMDDGVGNQWDNGTVGNYWDDYTGVDANDDGIGDTPYYVFGEGGGVDHFPRWDDGPGAPFPEYIEILPFVIDDTGNGDYTWAELSLLEDWCTGSGTIGDPYIIEKVLIDGMYSGNCLEIWYSDVHFIIRDCIFRNSGDNNNAGIWLFTVSNGEFSNNTFLSNYHGIFFDFQCYYNNISNNRFINQRHDGIDLEAFCNYNVIDNNLAVDNGQHGIVLRQDCDFNLISNNEVSGHIYSGILIQNESNNNTIISNIVMNNPLWGIWVYNSNNNIFENNVVAYNGEHGILITESDFNIIQNNQIYENTVNGISFESYDMNQCSNNKIVGNEIRNNLGRGIYLDNYTHDTQIYLNEIIDNNEQAVDDGFNNNWDNGSIGNYWSDYIGVDQDDDGIGDSPYIIEGVAGSVDNYPIWDDGPTVDDIEPSILINYYNEYVNTGGAIYIKANITDNFQLDLPVLIEFYFPNGTLIDIFEMIWSYGNIYFYNLSVDSLPLGNDYYFVIRATDTSNNTAYITRYFSIIDYWVLSPLIIDDMGTGDLTWTEAADTEWCSGSGTFQDPYVISNIFINGLNITSCITIRNSNAYFTIVDSIFLNASMGYAGISLENATNAIVNSNLISHNEGSGIDIISCFNVLIQYNHIYSNDDMGIFLYFSNQISILHNNISSSRFGIYNWMSSYFNVSGNEIFDNRDDGVYIREAIQIYISNNKIYNHFDNIGIFLSFCNHSIVINNHVFNGHHGIYNRGENNYIASNLLEYNIYGLVAQQSFYSIHFNNTIIENERGIYVDRGTNTFYMNYLDNLIENVYEDTTIQNNWFYDSIGNYYSDYTGVDLDDNGIGDTPHPIPGRAGSVDPYPIWDDGPEEDNNPPTTNIILSGILGDNGWFISQVLITLNATDDISGVYITEYSLDSINWINYTGPFTISTEGSFTIYYRSIDKAGNIEDYAVEEFNIDLSEPITTVILDGTLGNNGWYVSDVIIDFSAYDAVSGIYLTEYNINGSDWEIYYGSLLFTDEGIMNIYYRSYDNAGNIETVNNQTIKIDKSVPTTTVDIDGLLVYEDWYDSKSLISLLADDIYSEVSITQYSFDGINWLNYTDPFYMEGLNLYYFSTDFAGNVEPTNSMIIKTIQFPLIIDELDPNNPSWEDVVNMGLCTGSGTLSDPYIIENFIFPEHEYLIEVYNSDKYFVIRNCESIGVDNGIYFDHVKNGVIQGNILNGIFMDDCEYIEIIDNIFVVDYGYIYLNNCNHSLIEGNYISGNTNNPAIQTGQSNYNQIINNIVMNEGGIVILAESHFNTILNNQILNNQRDGLFMDMNCDYNTISNNNISNNDGYGIRIAYQYTESNNNDIFGNYIYNNSGAGIYLENAFNTVIQSNTLLYNLHGIYLENCQDTDISENQIVNNHGDGIRIVGCNNMQIHNNVLAENIGGSGIMLDSCTNSIFTDNLITLHNVCGFYVIRCQFINITKNQMFENDENGVCLISSVNVIVSKNNISNHINSGILLEECNECVIEENQISETIEGIWLIRSTSNIIISNYISNSITEGIWIVYGNNNTIESNTIVNNGARGIYIIGDEEILSEFNIIYNNTIEDNIGTAIRMEFCQNSNISENRMINNEGLGITLYYCSKINASGNIITYNNEAGIAVEYSNNNTISNNEINQDSPNVGIGLFHSSYNIVSNNILNGNEIGSSGIHLQGSNFNTISDNSIFDFQYRGIHLRIDCNDNLITTNNISDCWTGIFLDVCHDNTLSGNFVENNTQAICLGGSYLNTISFNAIKNNGVGILIEEAGYSNSIIGNIVSESTDAGILVDEECNNNLISENIVRENFGDGIVLRGNGYNIIKENSILDNGIIGLRIQWGSENLAFLNFFSGNLEGNAYDDGEGYWDNGTVGNYWDDYTGVDKNDDGIGDTPYIISSELGIMDNYPIWDDGPNVLAPIIIDELGAGDYTWEEAANERWCTGSGTWSDPYIIQDIIIDGRDSGYCLQIKNSIVPFIIRNCKFYNSSSSGAYYAGIYLYKTSNGKIFNNTIGTNMGSGIYLMGYGEGSTITCRNNTIIRNTIKDAVFCISLTYSDYNTILDNYFENAELRMRLSNYNNISNNQILYGRAQMIFMDCHNNIISRNIIDSHFIGINLQNCRNFIISDNSLIGGGLSIVGSFNELSSHTIDTTNIVNNKILYYYTNKIHLHGNDFLNAGQIILINCSDSLISSLKIENGTSGISIYYSENNTIVNNNITGQTKDGIYLYNSHYNNISNNILNYNQHGLGGGFGISLYGSHNNIIFSNDANYNARGLYLWKSQLNNISHNHFNTNEYGIYLEGSKNNTIYRNDICNNRYGFFLTRYQPTDSYSTNNTISENFIYNNRVYGVYLITGQQHNQFIYNNFTENAINAKDDGIYNLWDNGIIGNYWDDYSGVDANDDGIGDIPYIISGSAGSIDHFPIWDDGVDIIPIIIDDLGYGDYTWEEAATEEWCSGSGTYSNPYVIENLVFLSYDGYIIEIRNSNAYFIIKNCDSSGINHGIYLENVRNAIIKNNELNGIYMDNCKLIEIKDNLITLNNVYLYNCNFINIKGNYITEVNTESILLTESSFNLITNNEITNNQGEGIRFEYRCMFNVIRDNIITECWGTGIFMEELCNYNIISGNYINSIHGSGIVLDACYKNLILNNTISENNFDGIALYSCGDSLITKNLIKYHEQYGISLVECFNIKVSENIAKYIDDYAICIEIGNDIVILKNKIQSEMGIGLYEATNCQIIYNSIKSVNIGPIDGINMLFCEYALISGNTIIQYAIGMDIEHSNNTIISNNIITKSNEIALFLDNSYGNSISNNILSENMFGIEMFYCGDSIITENFIENHDQYSISLIDCYGIEISDNDIRVNEDYGIVIEYCESDISILNNKIHYGSGGGIVLGISNNALVKGNYINNPMSEGIILEESNNNKVLKNIIIRAEGIILTGSCNNFISGNIITSEDNEFETIGIWIESESNYNIICKNYISQLTAGILIDNCQGNKISNNLLNCNLYYGLRMDYSNFNTINNNIVIGNEDFGFYFYQSNNNSVSGNFIRNNAITGICLTHSNHNVVSFNTIIENKIGIMIEEGGYDNSLIGNFVSRSFNEGIYLVECNNNIISGNMVRDNSWDGINVAASSDNIITKNFIISNGMIGLRVQLDSTNNIIYQNYFVENLLGNAIDDGVNNYWDNGEIGNYWDDYTGVDENNDGIGDTPYNIPGLAGNKDYYPIWEDNYTWYESFDVLYYHKPKPKAIN